MTRNKLRMFAGSQVLQLKSALSGDIEERVLEDGNAGSHPGMFVAIHRNGNLVMGLDHVIDRPLQRQPVPRLLFRKFYLRPLTVSRFAGIGHIASTTCLL